MWYHVAEPNTYLVITGAGIKDVAIKKKVWVLPGQKVTKISVTPFDFSMTLQAMTKEKLKFSLPAVFTIGPQENDYACMQRYATLLTGTSDGAPVSSNSTKAVVSTGRNHVQDIVKGIIEGETRSIVSNMTIEEVFASRAEYKKQVIEKVQGELNQFGLMIYNANVKELEDTPGSEYFSFMRRKAHESASNKARVDVAEAQAEGQIGEALKTSRAKQEIAKINAATAVAETERKTEKAQADARLQEAEITIERGLNLERIAAARASEARDAQLQRDVEVKRADMELERLRAKNVVGARIEREARQQKAEADLFAARTKADGEKYAASASADAAFAREQRQADAAGYAQRQAGEAARAVAQQRADGDAYARVALADAALAAARRDAEAQLLVQQAKAAGVSALAAAYAELAGVLGGPAGLMQYLMLQDGTFEKLALANAKAVQGLAPKISVWNTGAEAGGAAGDAGAAIRNVFQALPPLMSTIQDQTGMAPPGWLVQMPQQGGEGKEGGPQPGAYAAKQRAKDGALVNGAKAA